MWREGQCRKCGRWTSVGDSDYVCGPCHQEALERERKEHERERQRQWERQREREEERARQEEMEWQRREDEERHHREMMELEERHHQELLDATLPWFPCSHCGNKTRQDKIKEVDGKKFCGDCASKIRECQYCHRNYVMKSMD